ncbi:hypothetical protein O1L60_36950 [Streptomyces diastatochromogenes]|nr:hypothetical protein [Streptomyces diastatochromogenes]
MAAGDRLPPRGGPGAGPGRSRPSALPAELDADPRGCLARLADEVAAGLLETADADRPEWAFPPSPEAFRTNNVCLAYGTAGVVHALRRAGAVVPEEILERLRRDTLALRGALPPGCSSARPASPGCWPDSAASTRPSSCSGTPTAIR